MVLNKAIGVLRTGACFFQNPLYVQEAVNPRRALVVKEAYVCRESIRGILLLSIPSILCSQRTMQQFRYDAPSKRSHGSSKDREETAIVGRLFVTGHLHSLRRFLEEGN